MQFDQLEYHPAPKDEGQILYVFDALFKAREEGPLDAVEAFVNPRLKALLSHPVKGDYLVFMLCQRNLPYWRNEQFWREAYRVAQLEACPQQDLRDLTRMVKFLKPFLEKGPLEPKEINHLLPIPPHSKLTSIISPPLS